ncbi:hypothetical protein [Sphingosinicella sp. BN140058]|uniref:hypothetical protein n=1 Tax=Sphingosinicella sp. BN140058 TaxID=1892855 RepID=UPI001013A73F|nr:hypothetical protein [Sphingosinicella sp. BN140058]QAY77784.1 hypothetical protein ETR14_15630 [Sphingosinicella sp. BN140058]
MTDVIARHRAAAILLALAALTALVVVPDRTAPAWGEGAGIAVNLLLILVALAGASALLTSPYLSILYREAPLKRAITGESELDEREVALRDRAAGMTYYLFATVNLVGLAAVGLLLKAGAIVLDGDLLLRWMPPYAAFAFALPVLTLEWFEPSSLWARSVEEDVA